ncbi:MAG: endonuclease domain-containing protein [Pirellula sp.]|jgi:very-short-patch-repair endonuclease|nr:endonuclease domain-containing protein [Pirellula sp.]
MAMEWQDTHEFAKHLKRAATPAGFLMWQLLRNRQRCGAKFRREYVKEPYILDFFCPDAKLCIECDGLPHLTPEGIAKDRKRTAWLNAQGIEVIRFTSREIEQDTQRVIHDIDTVLKRRLMRESPPHPPTPSPPEEEKGS